MGKNSWNSGPILRAEQSGTLAANGSNRITLITYDQDFDTDDCIDSTYGSNTANTETLKVNKPLCINEYSLTVATNDLCVIHQFYGHKELGSKLWNWDTAEADFHRGLKQWAMVPGSKQKYPMSWEDEGVLETDIDVLTLGHSNMYAVRTIGFKKRKGARAIKLSKNKGSIFGTTVSNLSGNADTFFYAVMEIKDWALLD
jgi:hypothetical protein